MGHQNENAALFNKNQNHNHLHSHDHNHGITPDQGHHSQNNDKCNINFEKLKQNKSNENSNLNNILRTTSSQKINKKLNKVNFKEVDHSVNFIKEETAESSEKLNNNKNNIIIEEDNIDIINKLKLTKSIRVSQHKNRSLVLKNTGISRDLFDKNDFNSNNSKTDKYVWGNRIGKIYY
jgi:hypothetical protein